MYEIYYVYPKYKNMSFSIIAKSHIEQLRSHVKIQEIDEDVLDNLLWLKPRNILLHPILYTTIGDKADLFEERQKRLSKLLRVKGVLGGFETSDSDRIGRVAVESLNKLDLVFLPSQFAIDVFKKSGVKIPLHLLPHGLSETMLSPNRDITHEKIKQIKDMKEKNSAIVVLFFMLHSEYRKGADLVLEAMRFLQQKRRDLYLVVKGGSHDSTYSSKFKMLRFIEVSGWLSQDVLRQLYDVSDILVVPSRGGGFELNALEGLARGLPTLVPNAGCFKDYIEYCVPLSIEKNPKLFPDNPIHVGRGWETTVDELAFKIDLVADCLEQYREKSKEQVKEITEKYNWKDIGSKLYEILKMYGFCG